MAHYQSRQLAIVTKASDAEAILQFCKDLGAEYEIVLPREFWPDHDQEPSIAFESGRKAMVWMRFGERVKPQQKILEFQFAGITNNGRLAALEHGRVFVHPISLDFPEVEEAWQKVTKFIKKFFQRHKDRPAHLPPRVVWVGPEAAAWLKEENHMLITSEDDYETFGLPPLIC